MLALDLVGPKGYEHGFIFVGTDSRHAAGYHGMQVVGITHRGNRVTGRYDHAKRQVVTPDGYRRDVTDIASYKQGTGQSQAPLRQALLSNLLDLVGPKGWEHGWIAVRPPATDIAARRRAAGMNRRIAHAQPGDWRAALHKYDQDVASGRIGFAGKSKFATSYPGEQASDRSLAGFMRQHTAPGDVSFRQSGGSSKLPTGKASESTAGRRALLRAGHALPPSKPGGRPGYPIGDADHWDKAFKAVGRSGGGARRAALRKLLIRTAPEFGRSGKIKGSWLDTSGGSKNMSNVLGLAGYGAQSATGEGMGGVGYGTGDSGYSSRPTMSGHQLRCPNCGYKSDDADFSISDGPSGTSDPSAPSTLKTPDPSVLGSPVAGAGFNAGQIAVRGAPSGSYGTSNTGGRAIELSRRLPVASASDIVIGRGEGGKAVIRHRRGGDMIGEMYRNEAGQWAGTLTGGKQLTPHVHQRATLLDLITSYNTGAGTMYHRPGQPESLIPRPVQTPLMQRFGIPAATTLATPMNGVSDGPRATKSSASDGDSDDGTAGLSPRGVTIYKKLKAKGFPAERALAFARRAQNFGGSK